MRNFHFWRHWLRILSVAIVAFGVIMSVFNRTVLFQLFNQNIDPVFWSSNAPPESAASFQGWVYGGWGATIAGWGVAMYFLASHAIKWQHRWAWNAVAFGLILWYVLDTFFSVFYQVYFNVAFNTLILILAGIPLIFIRSSMQDQRS